ncbi:hypothetical protein SAMN06272735_9009 [Streptomyces sp. TLI_55]|uniref:hypothetical protein n=1 Tax=Streptomyces sp. TLI_55 TaxID=1938861 RepID=UPI000BC90FDB|nr:hypothetical protein [Streptomyces sp. TLI_55]SNX88553.1 hypothetical protein SAMN06272735_9009 [Streptomyces sp. TLI_55]
MQSAGTLGNDHARAGQQWWAALPLPYNKSNKPIEITGAKFTRVPKGLEVVGYGAYARDDSEGVVMLMEHGSPGMPRLDKLKDHFRDANQVKAKTESSIYYGAWLKVTGRITGNLGGCKFEYRQSGSDFDQTLDCDIALRVEKKS